MGVGVAIADVLTYYSLSLRVPSPLWSGALAATSATRAENARIFNIFCIFLQVTNKKMVALAKLQDKRTCCSPWTPTHVKFGVMCGIRTAVLMVLSVHVCATAVVFAFFWWRNHFFGSPDATLLTCH